ncbi:MAG: hypothetical protein PWR12_1376 [Eubacteriaceae bacterium]|nr:hypothetical protein [Eubacteriaceae bacterium]
MPNVSRVSMKEALKDFEERGFVERQQGIGIKVINKSVEVASKSLRTMTQVKWSYLKFNSNT